MASLVLQIEDLLVPLWPRLICVYLPVLGFCVIVSSRFCASLSVQNFETTNRQDSCTSEWCLFGVASHPAVCMEVVRLILYIYIWRCVAVCIFKSDFNEIWSVKWLSEMTYIVFCYVSYDVFIFGWCETKCLPQLACGQKISRDRTLWLCYSRLWYVNPFDLQMSRRSGFV